MNNARTAPDTRLMALASMHCREGAPGLGADELAAHAAALQGWLCSSGRIEKAFRHFGHDITCEDHVLEAGLGFAVDTTKAEFIGREAVLRKRDTGLDRRLLQFRLNDPEPLLYHNEPILRDGVIVGQLSSGAYGHHLGGAMGMGYVPCKGQNADEVLASSYAIDVAGRIVPVTASLRPMYDPGNERMKA